MDLHFFPEPFQRHLLKLHIHKLQSKQPLLDGQLPQQDLVI